MKKRDGAKGLRVNAGKTKVYTFIPEQFTVKAYPALFGGVEGEGEG